MKYLPKPFYSAQLTLQLKCKRNVILPYKLLPYIKPSKEPSK